MSEKISLKKIGQYLGYLAIRGSCFLVGIVPQKIIYKLADALGIFAFYLTKKYRNIVINNLKYIFEDKYQDKEIKKIAKDVFKNQAKNLFEFLLIPKMSKEDIRKKMEAQNINYLDEALKEKKGVILISAHLGNWEMGLIRMAVDGYPLQGVYRPLSDKNTDTFVKNIRIAKGVKMIPRDSAQRDLYYNCLKNNEILILVIDQNAGEKVGILIDFLGRPAYAFCGWVILHQKMSSPIVVVICKRNKDNSHTITFEKPMHLEFTNDKEKDLHHHTQRVNKIIEEHILKDPAQWFWLHKRWKIS